MFLSTLMLLSVGCAVVATYFAVAAKRGLETAESALQAGDARRRTELNDLLKAQTEFEARQQARLVEIQQLAEHQTTRRAAAQRAEPLPVISESLHATVERAVQGLLERGPIRHTRFRSAKFNLVRVDHDIADDPIDILVRTNYECDVAPRWSVGGWVVSKPPHHGHGEEMHTAIRLDAVDAWDALLDEQPL